jgi:hypothetical protein
MDARFPFVLAAGLALALASPASAGPDPTTITNLAELAPAHTIGYLELSRPDGQAREVRALLDGSCLQAPDALGAGRRQGRGEGQAVQAISAILSPEVIDELGDWSGGLLALTGFTKNGFPEIVAVLLTGKGRLAPLSFRVWLAGADDVTAIDRIENVTIYQVGKGPSGNSYRATSWGLGRPAPSLALRGLAGPSLRVALRPSLVLAEEKREEKERPEWGMFCAQMPGALIAGSTPGVVADMVRRLRGKQAGPSLAGVSAFREASALRDRPGLFGYLDLAALDLWVSGRRLRERARRREEIRRQHEAYREQTLPGQKKPGPEQLVRDLRQAEEEYRRDSRPWDVFRELVNPTGLRFLAASGSLHRGDFSWRMQARLRDGQSCPLLEVLSDAKLSDELLRAAPADAFVLLGLPMSDASAALKRAIRLAGSVTDEVPQSFLCRAAMQLKLRLLEDMASKVKGVALAAGLEASGDPRPVLLVEAVDAEAVRHLMVRLPHLFDLDLEDARPVLHKIDSQTVHSLTEDENSSGSLPPHFGRHGKVLVLGWNRRYVAATLKNAGRKKKVLGLSRTLSTVRGEGPVSVLGLLSCRQYLEDIVKLGSEKEDLSDRDVQERNYLRELSAPMAAMPPTLFVVKRQPNGASFEVRQGELRTASVTVIDIALAWLAEHARNRQRWQMGGRVVR